MYRSDSTRNVFKIYALRVQVCVLHLSVSHSVHRGGVVSQHALQVSRPTPRGEVEGSGLAGSPGPHPGGSSGPHLGRSPGPHLGGESPGPHWGVSRPKPGEYPSMHWGRHPPSRRLLLQEVRILLECILVFHFFTETDFSAIPVRNPTSKVQKCI